MPLNIYDLAQLYGDLKNASRDVVRDYDCRGDGKPGGGANIANAATDAAMSGGGIVYLPPGNYRAKNLPQYAGVYYMGAGRGATTVTLEDNANTDLFAAQTSLINLGAGPGTGPAGSLYNFGIMNMTLDGNKANQSGGTSYPLRFYGYGYTLQNLYIRNGYSGGVLADWNGGAASPGNDSMEATWSDIKIHDNNGIGLETGGPHDSQFRHLIEYNSGSHGVHIAPNATALQFLNSHVWNIPQGQNAVGWLVEAGYCQFMNCESEKTDGMSVALLASECRWDGHIFDAGATNSSNGMQLGQTAGNTPYPGMIKQSGGLTTAVVCGGCVITSFFDYCGLSNGALWFANSGGGNVIQATIFQTAGSGITGTPNPQDSFLIYVKGLTPDGTLGKSGGMQLASSANNGMIMYDQAGNQFFKISPASQKFLLGNSGTFRGFSDAFFSTQTFMLNAANGSLQLGNSSTLYSGSGVPASGLGANGDFYFRQDTTASPHIYKKISGTWTTIV